MVGIVSGGGMMRAAVVLEYDGKGAATVTGAAIAPAVVSLIPRALVRGLPAPSSSSPGSLWPLLPRYSATRDLRGVQ